MIKSLILFVIPSLLFTFNSAFADCNIDNDWQLSPYDESPTPMLDVDVDKVTITWTMYDKDDQYTIWKAIDYEKDDIFEITSLPETRD